MNETVGRRNDSVSRWVCFELAGQTYGLPILDVQEVLLDIDIEPVPGAAPDVLGVINLRGAIVSVIDLRRRLGLPERGRDEQTRIIVLRHADGAVGLRVDRVTQVRAITDTLIKPAPATGAREQLRPVRGVHNRNGEMLSLLDAAAVLG